MSRLLIISIVTILVILLMTCAQDFMSDIPCNIQTECPKNYKCEQKRCVPCNPQECQGGYYMQPGFQVLASSLDFGDVQVGTQKISTVDIKYVAISGASILIKGSVETDGKDKNGKDVFRAINESHQELKPGTTLAFQVSYHPKAITTNSAYLVISSAEPGNPTTKVRLTGRGVDPEIVVSPSSIEFDNSFKNGPEQTREIKISNTGSGALEIESVSLATGSPPDFSLRNTPVGGSKIQPNASITFKVAFKPTTPGTLTTTVIIKSADKEKPIINISVRAYVSDECEPGYYDMNKDASDGCECFGDKRGGNSCESSSVKSIIQGDNLPDTGGCVTVTGNLVPEDAEDWWTFIGVDTADVQGSSTVGGDRYKISINFLSNPDQLIFDVYKGCLDKNGYYKEYCSGAECIPKKEDRKRNLEDGYNQKCSKLEFDMSKNTKLAGDIYTRGQEVCQLPVHKPQMENVNYCIDDTARYYIRVYRNKDSSSGIPLSKASCEKYVLQVCNGK
ncbi:MAG: choice-of-anchor D domain-containing protein [Deltaproteobacteria bacterium]|nr:choice-of-anchor D domain-containing protein [Deltaproteobacteria bacterium]